MWEVEIVNYKGGSSASSLLTTLHSNLENGVGRRSANCSSQAPASQVPADVNKVLRFFQDTTLPIHSCIVCVCFCTVPAEWGSLVTCGPQRLKHYQALLQKKLAPSWFREVHESYFMCLHCTSSWSYLFTIPSAFSFFC